MGAGAAANETVYGITSLRRDQADAAQIAAYIRKHWHIENRLHYVRDETFGEDRCRVRKDAAPQVLAAIRNALLLLLRRLNLASVAKAQRRCALRRNLPIKLIFQRE